MIGCDFINVMYPAHLVHLHVFSLRFHHIHTILERDMRGIRNEINNYA